MYTIQDGSSRPSTQLTFAATQADFSVFESYERVRENTGPDKHLLPTATLLLLASSVASPTTGVSFVTTSIAASTAGVATLVSAAITSTASVTTSISTTSIATTSTASSITATAATSTSETAASTSTSRATLASLVDTDGAAIELNVVHGSNGSFSIGLLTITDKAETTTAASVTILDDDSLLDGAELLELLTKRILISVPCEAANEELRHLD